MSDHRSGGASSSRGGEGRGVNGRGAGGRASAPALRSAFRETGPMRIPLATAAKVTRAADLTKAKAERHYEKHRATWVARSYNRLLLKAAPTLSLTPPGMVSDPKAALMARAAREVGHRQSQRTARIERAGTAMPGGAAVRTSRKMAWGKGLGD